MKSELYPKAVFEVTLLFPNPIVKVLINASPFIYLTGNTYISNNSTIFSTNQTDSCELFVDGNIWASVSINAPEINASSTYTTSDYRIKGNIKSLDETFKIDKLNPIQYHNKLMNKTDYGFIAHEIQEIYPNLVKGNKDGPENQSIN